MKKTTNLEEILAACISDNKQVYIAPTPVCISDENPCGLNRDDIKIILKALTCYAGDVYILEKFEDIGDAMLTAKDGGIEYPKTDLTEGVM